MGVIGIKGKLGGQRRFTAAAVGGPGEVGGGEYHPSVLRREG